MYKDIEYEREGVKKFASERFKDDLLKAGWSVVETEEKPKRGRRKKDEESAD